MARITDASLRIANGKQPLVTRANTGPRPKKSFFQRVLGRAKRALGVKGGSGGRGDS